MLKLLPLRRFTLVILFLSLIFAIGLSVFVYYLWNYPDVSRLKDHYPVYDFKKQDYVLKDKRPVHWVDIENVPKYAKMAIVVSEDWAFYDHHGVDLNQLRIAIGESIKQAKLVRGASTITQQVIKNTMLSQDKTLWRKFREMILSYRLEMMMDKERILEIYLNLVELGKEIYGIKRATHYYFNKKVENLTAREGAFLAMLLPSPVKYSISFRNKKLTDFASEVIDSILIKLRQADVYTEKQRLIEKEKLYYWETPKQIQYEYSEKSRPKNEGYLDFQVYE